MTIEQSLDFILGHLERPLWPRTISTEATEGRQVLVYNEAEALSRFKQANLIDCRISAYRSYTEYKRINRQEPNLIFIDLDLSRFTDVSDLERGLNKTLTIIKTKFYNNNIEPTILHTGNGYHIYLPIDAIILESQSVFAEYDQPSRKFMQWSEQYLSNKRADPCHSKGLSFKNCMLRVPGSNNSKNSSEVKIVQKYNGIRPSMNWLLRDFRRYLIQDKFEQKTRQQQYRNTARLGCDKSNANTILWIEGLLQTAISDYRKNAIRLILAPYLMNIKHLSFEKAFGIIKNWLDSCNAIRPLDFSGERRIKNDLKAAIRVGYLPISFNDLKTGNKELHKTLNRRQSNSGES